MRIGTIALAGAMLVTLLAAAGPVAAQDGDLQEIPVAESVARGHFRLGAQLYSEGDFVRAAHEFEEAHRLSGRPELLYNIYLCYRDAQQPEPAAQALRGYLREVPEARNAPQLHARLERLEADIAQRRSRSEQEASAPDTGSQAEVDADVDGDGTSTEAPSNSLHWAGIGLLVGGGALVVGAVITGVLAASERSDLSDVCDADGSCPASAESKADRGQNLAITTDALWIAGATAAVTGVVLMAVGASPEEQSESMVTGSASCVPTGCAFEGRVRF